MCQLVEWRYFYICYVSDYLPNLLYAMVFQYRRNRGLRTLTNAGPELVNELEYSILEQSPCIRYLSCLTPQGLRAVDLYCRRNELSGFAQRRLFYLDLIVKCFDIASLFVRKLGFTGLCMAGGFRYLILLFNCNCN